MSKKKKFITGVCGFIGFHLANEILKNESFFWLVLII